MKLVLLGAPGAGKGTLAKGLIDALSVLHVSTGDILREQLKNETELGLEAKKHMESGGLVPDEIVTKLVENKFVTDEDMKKGFMLDGFPRTLQQAEDLEKILEKVDLPIDYAICLEASLEIVLQRLTGRRVCKGCGALYHVTNMPSKEEGVCDKCGGELYQRADDNEETIKNRMDIYKESTKPIIDFYEAQGKLMKADADKEASEVKEVVLRMLNECA